MIPRSSSLSHRVGNTIRGEFLDQPELNLGITTFAKQSEARSPVPQGVRGRQQGPETIPTSLKMSGNVTRRPSQM